MTEGKNRNRRCSHGVLTAVVVTGALACVDASRAEAQRPVEQQLFDSAVKRALLERAVAEPLTGSGQGAAQHQLTVLAEKGDVNGRARFFIPLGPFADAILTFTGPLNGGNATLATEAGLQRGASLNGGVKFTFWNRVDPRASVPTATATPALALVAPGAATTKGQLLQEIERRRTSPAAQSLPLAERTTQGRMRFARALESESLRASPERFYAVLAQTDPALTSIRWAATLTPGFETRRHAVDYLTETSFDSATFDRSTKTFTVTGGVSKLRATTQEGKEALAPLLYFGAAFRAGNAIDIAEPRKVCRALSTPGVSECVEGPVGEPGTGSERSFTAELRLWTPKQGLGVNPRYTYGRTKSDGAPDAQVVHTVDAPIYFMRQAKDIDVPEVPAGADLVGGVTIGWRSAGSAKGAFVALFLTKAFGLP